MGIRPGGAPRWDGHNRFFGEFPVTNAESQTERAGRRRWVGKAIGARLVVGILGSLGTMLVSAVERARNAARSADTT